MTIQIYGSDLLTSLLEFAMHAVPGGVGAGISVAEGRQDSGQPRSVAAVGLAGELDQAQWAQASGPLWDAFRSGLAITRPAIDAAEAGASPEDDPLGLAALKDISPQARRSVRGAVFSAGEWGGELPVIVSIYLDRRPDTKTLRVMDRWEPTVTQALAVVEYCSGQERVAEQMLQMSQYRRVIEQAKGLVMGALGSDAATAFATLSRASQHFNVRLRNLAVALVEHVGAATAEHPADAELVIRPSADEAAAAKRVWAALTTSTAIFPSGSLEGADRR